MARLSLALAFVTLSLLVQVSAYPTHHIRRHRIRATAVTPYSTPSSDDVTPKANATSTADDSTATVEATTSSVNSSNSTANATVTDGAPSGQNGRVASLMPVPGAKRVISYSDLFSDAVPVANIQTESKAGTNDYDIGTFHGRTAIEAHMNAGSRDPGSGIKGGISFYTPVDGLEDAVEIVMSYSVFFDGNGGDFDCNKGGKLPGPYMGNSASNAKRCSGGRYEDTCASSRLMFRTNCEGEVYMYIPPPTASTPYNNNDHKCGKTGTEKCDDTGYGYSVGRGSWTWPSNEWVTVSQRLRLNTVGQANGEVTIYINGETKLHVPGLVIRVREDVRFWGMQMQTFFGGHTLDWNSPKDQRIYFGEMTISIVE